MLAHQGGWDEILLVAGPIAVIVLVLWQATRRADRQVPSAIGRVNRPLRTSSNEGTKSSQFANQVVIATINVMNVVDHCLATRNQAGHH